MRATGSAPSSRGRATQHSQRGARVELRAVPNDEPGMSPMELWCNEAQERYVLVIAESGLERFEAILNEKRETPK